MTEDANMLTQVRQVVQLRNQQVTAKMERPMLASMHT